MRDTVLAGVVSATLAASALAEGTPSPPPPGPPPVVVQADNDSDAGPPHRARGWDICCLRPDGRRLLKVAGNIEGLRPWATATCKAATDRPACTERQMSLGVRE